MPSIPKEQLDPEMVLVLYAVSRSPDGVPTKTHYQKMMYLILKALGNDPRTSAGYVPHHYGPYSPVVDSWRDVLIDTGYLRKNSREKITVAPDVMQDVRGITFDDPLAEMKIDSISRFINSLSYDELILYIYTDDEAKNEGMTVNSDVRDDIFDRRVEIAKGMCRKGKVSVSKGAEMAGMDIGDFERLVEGMSS